jgi:aspartate/methionine/tyrosine aminotransferase
VNALKLYAHEKDYLPAKGLPALKEAVAGFHKAKDNVDANPDPLLNTLPVNMRHSFTAGMMKERP